MCVPVEFYIDYGGKCGFQGGGWVAIAFVFGFSLLSVGGIIVVGVGLVNVCFWGLGGLRAGFSDAFFLIPTWLRFDGIS